MSNHIQISKDQVVILLNLIIDIDRSLTEQEEEIRFKLRAFANGWDI